MKKFIPQSPDPYIKKEADMGLAKFGHLNAIVAAFSTIDIDVTLTSVELATIGSTPLKIYDAPPAG